MEVAGFVIGAVGLVPPTMALIECCASFYKDVYHSEQESSELGLKFEQLASRYDSTQKILFEKDKFAFAKEGLFSKLAIRDQRIVFAMLQQLPRLLYQFYILAKSYQIKKVPELPKNQAVDSKELHLTTEAWKLLFDDGQAPPKPAKGSFLSFRGLRWSARGKARAEDLLAVFEDWLKRIRAVLEDAWFPMAMFHTVSNLEAVESDKDAKSLGVAQPVTLRKLIVFESSKTIDLEIRAKRFQVQALSTRRGISQLDGEVVLVEMLPYTLDSDGFMPKMLEARFSTIAGLLHYARDPDFRVLDCKGYVKRTHPSPQLQLVYRTPGSGSQPLSLLEKLTTSARVKPSLGSRVQLGHQLAVSISLMHSVGWIHRGLRSENVLFFHSPSPNDKQTRPLSIDLDNPKICGFEASRLESDFSSGPYDDDIALDIYRHPQRWGTPKKPFNKYHDIYALGVMLLEIGLWEQALTMGGNDFRKSRSKHESLAPGSTGSESTDPHSRPSSRSSARSPELKQSTRPSSRMTPEEIKTELVYQTDMRLGHRCGESFQRIVRRCLTSDFDVDPTEETKLETVLQGQFRELVIEPLAALQEAL